MDEQSGTASVPSRDLLLPASILVAGILIAGSIIYVLGAKNVPAPGPAAGGVPATAAFLKAMEGDAILGSKDAPVTVVEYGDYQCPFCGTFFSDIEPAIREKYVKTGKAQLIFRNFQFLGPESLAAGEAAECARDQGQFWAYHDSLYRAEIADGKEHNGNLNEALFVRLAKELKLDEKAFTACIQDRKNAAAVTEETAKGREAGVNATPTTFVNGVEIRGLAPNDTRVADAIEAALKSNR
ncbi:MAG: DsbA family protein [Candidatus Liptonbacteria bacterium]|nr:DsbA family protein [Candidatus Liptonbacteria bacterium]